MSKAIYNAIIAVRADPPMTRKDHALMKEIRSYVSAAEETRPWTDPNGVTWVAAQVAFNDINDLADMTLMLQARSTDPASQTAAAAAATRLRGKVGKAKVDFMAMITGGKQTAGQEQVVIPVGLWCTDRIITDGPNAGQALQQGYRWEPGDPEATPPTEGRIVPDEPRPLVAGFAFNLALYLNLQADDTEQRDEDGNVTRAAGRPTAPRQWNVFAGYPARYLGAAV